MLSFSYILLQIDYAQWDFRIDSPICSDADFLRTF